ncbi:MAG TPA: hypothetical protein VL326_20290 [Kofleriaceae bacterium]|jgi:hypothetical protein|nr:hypothetical protein [Kofleriaceae bacterium]
MRSALVLVLFAAIGCGTDGSDGPESTLAFTVTSSDFTLQPGQETTKCFYFHTTNPEQVLVNKWVSDMTPGSHHMIAFSSLGQQPADGTVDNCEGADVPLPMFGTQVPHEELVFPDDDGFGKPLVQIVEPNMAAYFQMHYLNTTDEPLQVHVSLSAYGLPATVEYTRTDLFATYNNDIAIPPGATNYKVSATCDIFDKKFWQMSSHSHKQSAETKIFDGSNMVLDSTDWEHPKSERWNLPTYYQFQSPSITWECTYNNTGDNAGRTVTAGQSAATNEMCMATGYYFPAVGPRGCVMDSGSCQCLL